MERADDRPNQARLAHAEPAGEPDGVSRTQRPRQFRADPLEFCDVFRTHAGDGFQDEPPRRSAKKTAMWWRANDVLVGAITGAISDSSSARS
jgi:hypothetical protein